MMRLSWPHVRRPLAALAAVIGVLSLMQAAWIEVKAYAAQALIEAAWERKQHGAATARPWPWADTTPVARLTVLERDPRSVSMPPQYAIPRGESLIVLEGSSGRNLAFGPTHDAASVLPGDAGNSVIAAHRDTHFKILETLAPGDRLRIERVDGRVTFFAVTDIRIVDSRTTRIALDAEEPRLTLVTCYPFDAIRPGGPLRFVVTADVIFIGKNRLRRFFRDPTPSPAAKSVVFAAYPVASLRPGRRSFRILGASDLPRLVRTHRHDFSGKNRKKDFLSNWQ